jgi:hypothetical protein
MENLVGSVSKFCSKTRIKRIKNIKSLYPIEHQCCGSVTWHGKDPDPQIGQIGTTDLRIRILLFSSVADKMPTKIKFFRVFCLLIFEGILTSVFINKKSKNSKNQGFSYFFCLLMEGSGSGILILRIRIRIHNTGAYFFIFFYTVIKNCYDSPAVKKECSRSGTPAC